MPQLPRGPSTGNDWLAKGEDAGVREAVAALQPAPSGVCSEEDAWVRPREDVRDFAASLWQGAWSRETWTVASCVRLAVSFVVLATCSWLGIMLSRQSAGVATIWLSNGILFGLVITQPRKRWLAYFAVGLIADTLADVVYGDPFRVAIGVSLANSVEVVTSCLVLTWWFGWPLNLSKRRPLIGFLLVSVVGAAALTSALGASWTLLFYDAGPWWKMWRTWYLGDMLGLALLGPLVFMLQRPGFFAVLRRGQLAHTLIVLLVPAVVTVLVFTHDKDPLIFFLYPALLLVVFRLGFSGTILTIFVVAFGSIALTVKGHGPLMLIPGEHMMLHRIVVVQIFLAVAIFTMFPVAALLEERAALQGSLEESEARYRKLAHADDLTGLDNRRAFNLRLEEEWIHAADAGEPIALLLLDADLFKRYNDIYGHLGGDECLRCIAAVIAEVIEGRVGTAARYGGEEFAVILPGEGIEGAEQAAEEICRAVEEMRMPHPGSPAGVQTVSVGVAALVPRDGQRAMELVTIADRALYRAKDKGRNQVVVA
ncbi:MAG TPA: diguanylate cyclase [Edaphobacter sp.]